MNINTNNKYNICFKDEPKLSFAAEELQAYCNKIFNSEFEIISEADTMTDNFKLGLFSEPDVSIELAKQGIDIASLQKKEGETYVILITDNAVCFYGDRPRSVLYAVYDFLRYELGCEYAISVDNCEYIPRLDSIDLAAVQKIETAAFPVRGLGFHTEDSGNVDIYVGMIDWLTKLKYNRIQINLRLWEELSEKLGPMIKERDLDLDLGVHSLGFFLHPSKYLESHPEWYVDAESRFGRQLRFSNLDSVPTAVENIIEYLKKTPGVKYLGLWPLDGTVFDPKDIASGKMGDIVLTYVNTITEKITKVFPELIIDHLAYIGYVAPPKKTLPDSKIMTSVCHYWDRNFTQPIYDVWYGRANNASEISKDKSAKNFSPLRTHRECCDDLRGWIDLGDTIAFTYYPDLNLSSHNIFDISDVIQQDMQYYDAIGAKGVLACYCMHREFSWFYREIQAMGTFQWNPYADSEKMNKKLLKAVFEDSADEMDKFYISLDTLHNKPLFIGFRLADLFRGIVPTYNLSGYNIKLHNLIHEQFESWWKESMRHLDNAIEVGNVSVKAEEYINYIRFNMEKQKVFFYLGCNVLYAFSCRELAANGKMDPDEADKKALKKCDEALHVFNEFAAKHHEKISASRGLSKKMNAYKSALEKDFPTMCPPF